MRRRQRHAYAVIPIALFLALAGCAGDGDGDGTGIASVGGNPSAAASSGAPAPESSVDPADMALKFAQCMREHGVDMPDPEIDGGRITQRIQKGGANAEAAQEACKEFAPTGGPGGKPDPQMQQRMLEHAQCMRGNGVEAFPDPNPNEAGIRINKGIADDPDFEAALQACDELMKAGK